MFNSSNDSYCSMRNVCLSELTAAVKTAFSSERYLFALLKAYMPNVMIGDFFDTFKYLCCVRTSDCKNCL